MDSKIRIDGVDYPAGMTVSEALDFHDLLAAAQQEIVRLKEYIEIAVGGCNAFADMAYEPTHGDFKAIAETLLAALEETKDAQ